MLTVSANDGSPCVAMRNNQERSDSKEKNASWLVLYKRSSLELFSCILHRLEDCCDYGQVILWYSLYECAGVVDESNGRHKVGQATWIGSQMRLSCRIAAYGGRQ